MKDWEESGLNAADFVKAKIAGNRLNLGFGWVFFQTFLFSG